MKFAAVFTLTTTNLTLIGYYPHYVNSSPLNWKQYRFVSEETKQKYTPIIEEICSETQAIVLDDASFITDLSPQSLFIDR